MKRKQAKRPKSLRQVMQRLDWSATLMTDVLAQCTEEKTFVHVKTAAGTFAGTLSWFGKEVLVLMHPKHGIRVVKVDAVVALLTRE